MDSICEQTDPANSSWRVHVLGRRDIRRQWVPLMGLATVSLLAIGAQAAALLAQAL